MKNICAKSQGAAGRSCATSNYRISRPINETLQCVIWPLYTAVRVCLPSSLVYCVCLCKSGHFSVNITNIANEKPTMFDLSSCGYI